MQVLSADVPALDGYVKHAFNGVLVGVDSSLRAVHAYGDAIYQIFSDHGDPSLDYSLRSLRVRAAPPSPATLLTRRLPQLLPSRFYAPRSECCLVNDCRTHHQARNLRWFRCVCARVYADGLLGAPG